MFAISGMQSIWLWFGIVLALAEFVVPGLVVVFVGMGAMTVALFLSLGWIENLPAQFTTWFIASMFYTLFLRMAVLHYFPMDTVRQEIDDIKQDIGTLARVTEKISGSEAGRIQHRESTWPATLPASQEALPGEEVRITGRDNLTWKVELPNTKENKS
jgi:membrane protein implicated in regulation of membrane protease activity